MAKKKKKKSLKRREMQEEAKEELEVLAAIFGDHFSLDEDAHGFTLQVVPHPGRTEPNYVSVAVICKVPLLITLSAQASMTSGKRFAGLVCDACCKQFV